ncbi:hypothetical protein RND81_09G164400 [Saponaria officinalis]|uniref:Leucine-rich repeat-containing N-terminal plant-type domain-containing protein n=1 Tax=Saponaria officinalis TaxID=3572 RepID=A0AAW1ILL5_SAPOF
MSKNMSTSNVYLLPLLIIFISQILYITQSQDLPNVCHPHDKKILLNIKNNLGNPSSLSSWDPNTDCCDHWITIQCNEQGHVTSLTFLQAHDVHGPIPPFLDQLPWLTGLYFLDVPNLSGPIPSYFRKLTNLTAFVISGTSVTGPIPKFLGQYTNLIQLNLPSNKLFGPVPEELSRMKSMMYLDLSNNSLNGSIPNAFAHLTNLTGMFLNLNKFSGPIPDFLANLVNVGTIDFSSNSLTGPIPAFLGRMGNLTTLGLSNNQLTGPVPKELGRSNLVIIGLANNKLSGDASFLFEKGNKQVNDIQISSNLLKFDFTNVDLSPNLSGFNISHNMIYGSLPKRFGQIWVDSFNVSYNQLCGPIPDGELFKQADPAFFSHNKCLCGGPLPACK